MLKRTLNIMCPLFLAFIISAPAHADAPTTGKDLITENIIQDIRNFVETDIVLMSIRNQNKKYGSMSELKILELDEQWRTETSSEDQPLISATLSNPLSSYLTRIQAHSAGLYTEMFAMDANGLNVGQSNISSDYWQGDEAKFQKTYPVGADTVFIDDPEYDNDLGIWRVQVNLAIADDKTKETIGAITVELNLSEVARRKRMQLL